MASGGLFFWIGDQVRQQAGANLIGGQWWFVGIGDRYFEPNGWVGIICVAWHLGGGTSHLNMARVEWVEGPR